jgi:hypothetical protein
MNLHFEKVDHVMFEYIVFNLIKRNTDDGDSNTD